MNFEIVEIVLRNVSSDAYSAIMEQLISLELYEDASIHTLEKKNAQIKKNTR